MSAALRYAFVWFVIDHSPLSILSSMIVGLLILLSNLNPRCGVRSFAERAGAALSVKRQPGMQSRLNVLRAAVSVLFAHGIEVIDPTVNQ